jgi:hypothetical protein
MGGARYPAAGACPVPAGGPAVRRFGMLCCDPTAGSTPSAADCSGQMFFTEVTVEPIPATFTSVQNHSDRFVMESAEGT